MCQKREIIWCKEGAPGGAPTAAGRPAQGGATTGAEAVAATALGYRAKSDSE